MTTSGWPLVPSRMTTPSLTTGWFTFRSISFMTSPKLERGTTTSAGTRLGPRRLTIISLKRFFHSCWAISSLSISAWQSASSFCSLVHNGLTLLAGKPRQDYVGFRQRDPLLDGVTVVLHQWSLVLQLCHAGVDETQ